MAGVKDSKDKKTRDDGSGGGGGTAALLRRLAQEVTALRADVETLRRGGDGTASVVPEPSKSKRNPPAFDGQADALKERLSGDRDAIIWVGHAYRFKQEEGDVTESDGWNLTGGLNRILEAPDAQVARLGLAFSSAPKVALIRALLSEGAQPAAEMGERAGLTTGSLYHHLRELTHAGVVVSAGRNRFQLTPLGLAAGLAMFALSGPGDTVE